MQLDKGLLRRQIKPAIERVAQELLDVVGVGLVGVDVNLEVIAVARRVDAHGDGVIAEGALQYRLRQIDQRQSTEEVSPRQLSEVRRAVFIQRFVVEAGIAVEPLGAEAFEPRVQPCGPGSVALPVQVVLHLVARGQALRIDRPAATR